MTSSGIPYRRFASSSIRHNPWRDSERRRISRAILPGLRPVAFPAPARTNSGSARGGRNGRGTREGDCASSKSALCDFRHHCSRSERRAAVASARLRLDTARRRPAFGPSADRGHCGKRPELTPYRIRTLLRCEKLTTARSSICGACKRFTTIASKKTFAPSCRTRAEVAPRCAELKPKPVAHGGDEIDFGIRAPATL